MLDTDLLTLSMKNSYSLLNDPNTDERGGMKVINTIVDSLFSIIFTLKEVPVIKARDGSLENVIAKLLTEKLQAFMKTNPSHFTAQSGRRSLLILNNRNSDLSEGLLHGWTYQALLSESAPFSFNAVTIGGTTEYIDTEGEIWSSTKNSNISDVADAITKQTKSLEQMKERLRDENRDIFEKTTVTIDEETYARSKRMEKEIDTHTTLAHEILKNIKSREMDLLYSYEDNIISSIKVDTKAMTDWLMTLSNEDDIVRFYYICYLNNLMTDELQSIIRDKNIELKEMLYIEKFDTKDPTPRTNNQAEADAGVFPCVKKEGTKKLLNWGTCRKRSRERRQSNPPIRQESRSNNTC